MLSRYRTPYTIHCSKVYPVPSPNGSNIIVCGHERGLLILWRGGRPLKESPDVSKEMTDINSANNQLVMIIDSDEEGLSPTKSESYINDAAFESEDSELDLQKPYLSVVQDLDLFLGTAVLQLSFPQIQHAQSLVGFHNTFPRLLYENLVIAVGCSDDSVRLLAIPLTPPSSKSKVRPEAINALVSSRIGQGIWGEQMIVMSGHQSLPKCVSVELHSRIDKGTVLATTECDQDEEMGQSSPIIQGQQSSIEEATDEGLAFVVSSCSSDLSGILLVHKVPISANGLGFDLESADHAIPWRSQVLPSSAVSIQLSPLVNPKVYTCRVLVADIKGSIRLFDCDNDSWIISISTGLQALQSRATDEKAILDAGWILGGKAIIVLMSNGEWGILDFAKAGPKSKISTNELTSTAGESPRTFDLGGWVKVSPVSRTLVKSSKGHHKKESRLAPMTPSTRRVRQENLFEANNLSSTYPCRGGISIYPTNRASHGQEEDETILMWLGGAIVIIPSLLTHWQNKVKGSGNLFDTNLSGQTRESSIANLSLLRGESCPSISLFPNREDDSQERKQDGTLQDVLVTGERSLIIIAPFLCETPTLITTTHTSAAPAVDDQQLLARGDLDIDGMDRVLAKILASKQQNGAAASGITKRRNVGFAGY